MGKEASKKMKELVEKKQVQLVFDGNIKTGRYGRLLAFVELDGVDIGAKLLKEGFANLYTKKSNSRMDEYQSLAKMARDNQAGLWNPSICNQ